MIGGRATGIIGTSYARQTLLAAGAGRWVDAARIAQKKGEGVAHPASSSTRAGALLLPSLAELRWHARTCADRSVRCEFQLTLRPQISELPTCSRFPNCSGTPPSPRNGGGVFSEIAMVRCSNEQPQPSPTRLSASRAAPEIEACVRLVGRRVIRAPRRREAICDQRYMGAPRVA